MKKIISFLATGLMAVSFASAQTPDALKVKTFVLDNGLTVWLNEDPNQTAVYGAVVVKAGAVDCPGTGIAHYFEHMMFKGTDKIGTIDYAAEKPYLDSISVMYDKLAEAVDDESRKAIQMEINRLSVKAADYAIPNEFDNLIVEMGGSGLNAFTSFDETVYHNMFLPEYFAQWAELNSERIMNPVFRLFQSELETVYEEKNMGDDNLVSDFRKRMLENIYKGTGYTEEVIGTTENLKNPRLAQMKEFFEKYYVANNMGLVLTGNITEAEALPVIRKTFGRIRRGEPVVHETGVLAPVRGEINVSAKINMPIVRLGAVCFRGPSKTDADFTAVSFLTSLLNNDAGTGLLDKLIVDHKLMMAAAMPDLSFRNAGSIMVLYMPKLLFQREKKATALIFDAFETLKNGDFTDEYFESCKLSYKKQLVAESEDLASRMQNMAFAFSDGLDWNEVVARPEQIDALTKEDIMALARKYFGSDRVIIHKEKGIAAREKLRKPDYEKVVPKNRLASSAYAQQLRKSAEGIVIRPKAIDYATAVSTVEIAPLVKLFAAKNPYNNVFDLTFSFAVGDRERPELERVAEYVNLLGTGNGSFDEIHSKLQSIGSSIAIRSKVNSFDVSVSGFDDKFDETLEIVADILYNIKGDRKKVSHMKTDEKSAVIMNRSTIDALDDALYQKVLYGDKSEYLVDKGEFTDEALLKAYRDVQKVECDVLYSGTLEPAEVASSIASHIDVNGVTVASNAPVSLSPGTFDAPRVFFVDKKDASQSKIRMLTVSDPAASQYDRYALNAFGSYLGGGMSSLLFQEIREFRSMAYTASGYFSKPDYKNRETAPTVLMTYVGTQSDKTIDAMHIVDSLVTGTPFLDSKIGMVAREALIDRCVSYPDFRSIAYTVATDLRNGFTSDPVGEFLRVNGDINSDWMKAVWEKYVAGRNAAWCIVGSASKVDMPALESYGTVTMLKASDIIR